MKTTSQIALPVLPWNALLARYDEIATKGANRGEFEQLLVRALRRALAELGPLRAIRERGRIFLLPKSSECLPPKTAEVLDRHAGDVFGLASISPGMRVPPTLQAIEAVIEQTFPRVYEAVAAAMPEPGTRIPYAMRAHRGDRTFPMKSVELEIHFAERLLARYPRLEVNLTHPLLRVDVEVRRDCAFVSYQRWPGPGGLPSGSGGRIVALLSGGFDSPVACYRLMRRGCRLHFVTYHSAPVTPPATVEKAARLVEILNRFQYAPGRLYAVNLLQAQTVIRDACNPRFRTVLYRRLMLRVANLVADAENALALATGENLGQVASQTLPNLAVIARASARPVLRPLLAYDKQDIIDLARRIGTFDTSREDVPDSCTVFAPRRPVTAARLEKVLAEEERLDIPALIRMVVLATRIIDTEEYTETVPERLHDLVRPDFYS